MRWQPDPTFYPSPKMAMEAPAEKLAYVAMLNPSRRGGDAMGVIDVDPESKSYGKTVGPGGHAERRRRTAPLRLERLQFLFVPIFAAPPYGAPLPDSSGSAVVPRPRPRYEAGSAESKDREGYRAGNDDEADRVQPSSHRSLRARRHLH